ncbi:MAG: GtrA family protein [Thermomonas sp.]|uniref:GtrA family protein n=1 Tax=Thermomonas sp. TaxID=1971895 RepID=UPI0039E6EED4
MTLRRHAAFYAVVGGLQWLLEYALMLTLSQWVMPVEPANVIGRLCGAVLGFWLNGKWTFAADDTHVGRHAALRFIVMWVALTALNTGIVAHLDDAFGLRTAQLLKPAADMLTGGIGFLLSRHWVYRKR